MFLALSLFLVSLLVMRDDDMKRPCSYALTVGALLMAIGIVGIFFRISSNDGALAISGAVLFSGSLISRALLHRK